MHLGGSCYGNENALVLYLIYGTVLDLFFNQDRCLVRFSILLAQELENPQHGKMVFKSWIIQ